MKMLHNRQRVAPRVLILQALGRLESEALSEAEFKAVLSALKLTGIPDAARRLMDDSQRFCLTDLLTDI